MSKKLFALLVILIFVSLGALSFFLWRQYSDGTSTSLSSLAKSVVEKVSVSLPRGALPSSSLVPQLADSVMLVAAFEPKNFEPLGKHFEGVRDRFSKTALWQKAGLDQIVDQYLNTSMDEVAAGALSMAGDAAQMAAGAVPPLTPAQIFTLLAGEWERLEEVVLAVDSETFEPIPGIEAPRVMLAAVFKDSESANRAKTLAFEQILQGNEKIVQEGVTFSKASDSKIVASLDFPGMGDFDEEGNPLPPKESPPMGGLEFIDNRAYVTVGAASFQAFVASAKGGTSAALPLGDSPRWSAVQTSLVENPALVFFYDFTRLFARLEALLGAFAPMGGDAPSPFTVLGLKGIDSAIASLQVSDGIGLRSCVTFAADSQWSKLYESFSAATELGSAGKVLKLVDQNSIAAGNLSKRFLDLYAGSARVVRLSQVKAAGEAPAGAAVSEETEMDWAKYQQTIEALGKLYGRRSLKNIGFILAGPRPEQMMMLMGGGAAPMFQPDVGLVFEFESKTSLQDVAQLLNDTAVLLVGDSGLVSLPVASMARGKPLADGSLPFPDVVRIALGDQTELIGAAADDRTILVAGDEILLDSLKRRLESTTPFITQEAIAARGIDVHIPTSDFYLVLSTSPLVELGRSFVPMGLMMVPPELKIGMPDIDEILKLLTVRLVTFQNSTKVDETVFCTEARNVAL